MKIQIKGHVIEVDDCDVALATERGWLPSTTHGHVYFHRGRGKGHRYLHRIIADAKEGELADHINRNTLDNRRCNLRTCTRSQSQMNTGIGVANKSGYKGVCWSTRDQRWRAVIKYQGHQFYLGVFIDKELARAAYIRAARELVGDFASE
jgi:hypothetical protein